MIVLWYIFYALWYFLPAGVGNATPVLANKIPVLKDWKTPLDFGKKIHGKRILGDNKTWRGLVFGTLVAGLIGLLQYAVPYHRVSQPQVSHLHLALILVIWFGAGALLGFGALVGDAVESFLKRQRDIESGNSWFPFDQLDYIIGGLIVTYPLARPSWRLMVAIIVTWFGVHLVTVYICYLLGIRDRPI